ncbi:uncharacterized protein EDB91DRAFT_1085624 [Suillus paluster]|uniref:uncharacterized protein n=1 Tax=Suillus paluster TaxID=48578 RepID=UPI001B879A53|nr:uncharacterized protein EDB91DRAFT_1085624 [Suillus paluster]KAG1729843.1 hypothetical protein EDB91DRAFT_1085624 [Suillus paluster]
MKCDNLTEPKRKQFLMPTAKQLLPSSSSRRDPNLKLEGCFHLSGIRRLLSPDASFRTLPIPAAAASGKSAWGSDTDPRITTVKSTPVITDYFTVTRVELPIRDGKHTSHGKIMKQIVAKFKVKIEASTNQSRRTTFLMKVETHKELDKAKRNLLATLNPTVALTLSAPAFTIPAIIGPMGATLNKVREATGVKVDIPRKDGIPNGHAIGTTNGTTYLLQGDEEEEVMVPITIIGPHPLVLEAHAMIDKIIASRTGKITQRVRDIPPYILPFVLTRRGPIIEAAQGADVDIPLNQAEREITVTGDHEGIVWVAKTITATIEAFMTNITSLKISLFKRQHHLLAANVASPEDPGDEVMVWRMTDDLPTSLGAVMVRANSQFIYEFPLPGPLTVSKQLLTYMTLINYAKTLTNAHPAALIFTPSPATIAQASVLNIDIVDEKPAVDAFIHRVIQGKMLRCAHELRYGSRVKLIDMTRLKQFPEAHNVQVFFPLESAEESQVLLGYDPLSPSASPSSVEREMMSQKNS